MRMVTRAKAHPDIGENGLQPADGAVSWHDLGRPVFFSSNGVARRAPVANVNVPDTQERTASRRPKAAFGRFDG